MTGENILRKMTGDMHVRQLAALGKARLQAAGVECADYDAKQLLFSCTGLTEASYLADPDRSVPQEVQKRYRQLISLREQRIPLQLILGSAWFYGREFFVNGDVLIPRPDTEILVEEAMKEIQPGDSVLDVCTGSGCILLTIACEQKLGESLGTDISAKALAVAQENRKRLSEEIRGCVPAFAQGDLLEPAAGRKFDVIVSNPPYIPAGVIPQLAPEVKDHDPLQALDGGEDGLVFYRRIAAGAGEFLKPDGLLFLEIGYDQAQAVSQILRNACFTDITVTRDYGGNDRVIRGVYGRS